MRVNWDVQKQQHSVYTMYDCVKHVLLTRLVLGDESLKIYPSPSLSHTYLNLNSPGIITVN